MLYQLHKVKNEVAACISASTQAVCASAN